MQEKTVLIIGASARAAAWSAARAGFKPYWIDRYGDYDLAGYDGAMVDAADYPAGLIARADDAPQAPWIYTGAMENHLTVLERIADLRPLMGNDRNVCKIIRDPQRVAACYDRAAIPRPGMPSPDKTAIDNCRYLIKPVHSAGGFGITDYLAGRPLRKDHYLQQFIEGEGRSAVYISNGRDARLLGVTRQLVGEGEWYAPPYAYCGSIGPLAVNSDEKQQWIKIGEALTGEFGVRGLFGVDAIADAGRIIPIEVNPRYTASVEVIELATGLPVIAMHIQGCTGNMPAFRAVQPETMIGKAILFAPRDLHAPDLTENGDWINEHGFPRIADIPRSGSIIFKGNPLITALVTGRDESGCRESLLANTARIYEMFAGPFQ
ncbi:MAG: ATP-grasp domain-containing protein [Gammaproteobacteria bacterium]